MAADGLRLTTQLLQDINRTITPVTLEGVQYEIRDTPDRYPSTFEIATTPTILVILREIIIDWVTSTETFNAEIRCYLGSTSEEIYDDLYQAGLLFEQNLIELYGSLISANGFYVLDNGETTGYRIEIVSEPDRARSSGVVSDLPYTKEGITYWGFVLTLPMQLTWGIEC